jgi:hypothetical protein
MTKTNEKEKLRNSRRMIDPMICQQTNELNLEGKLDQGNE